MITESVGQTGDMEQPLLFPDKRFRYILLHILWHFRVEIKKVAARHFFYFFGAIIMIHNGWKFIFIRKGVEGINPVLSAGYRS